MPEILTIVGVGLIGAGVWLCLRGARLGINAAVAAEASAADARASATNAATAAARAAASAELAGESEPAAIILRARETIRHGNLLADQTATFARRAEKAAAQMTKLARDRRREVEAAKDSGGK